MAAEKRYCLGCGKKVSPRTIQRHLKNKQLCNPQTARSGRLQRAVKAALARARRAGLSLLPPAPRPVHPSRHYHRRNPPQGPPPPSLHNRCASLLSNVDFDFPMGSPEPEHPNFQYDTPGASPGPSTRTTSPRFAPPPAIGEDDEYTPITLQDIYPGLGDLSTEEYLTHKFLSQLVRTGGKHVFSLFLVCMLI